MYGAAAFSKTREANINDKQLRGTRNPGPRRCCQLQTEALSGLSRWLSLRRAL